MNLILIHGILDRFLFEHFISKWAQMMSKVHIELCTLICFERLQYIFDSVEILPSILTSKPYKMHRIIYLNNYVADFDIDFESGNDEWVSS